MVELLQVYEQQVVQGLVGLIYPVVTVEGDTLHQAGQEVCEAGKEQQLVSMSCLLKYNKKRWWETKDKEDTVKKTYGTVNIINR